ncbi:MAG: ABC transporter permease [Clostridiales bacterium]|nr:ABC transporter permease [Clostridiales bacterium]
MDSAKSANKKAIIAALLALALVVGCILLPLSSEKILCAVVVVLIAGALFFRNDTGRYVCKRILLALLTVFIIAAITFFSMNAIPGGPFSKEKAPSAAVQAVLEERFHLNEPVGKQFLLYLEGLLQGNFGVSTKTGREIATTIFDSFRISAKLGGYAALLAVILGIVLGSVAALNRGKVLDRIIIFFTTLFVAVPSFIMATLLLLVFCLQLGWFPIFSTENPSYVLPVVALMLSPMSYITRLTKTSMLDVLGQDYIRTARAKGVKERLVIFKHALKNALIPVITYVGPMTAYILTGSMVVESVFTTGGLGTKFVQGISNRDYPMIMGTTIFLATLMVTMTLISDLVYKVVDPRISFD